MRIGLTALLLTPAAFAANPPHDSLADRARSVLTDALAREQAFIKVHAAEALIALGDTDSPRRAFTAELPAANDARPYRIGVWRVLAATSASPAERATWIARTEAAFLDTATTDRIHAIESLCKLGHVPSAPVREAAQSFMAKASESNAVFLRWSLHIAGDRDALPAIVAALDSTDPVARLRAAYVLQRVNPDEPSVRHAMARTAKREPPDAIGYSIVMGAAVALDADPARTSDWVGTLEKLVATGTASARYMACQVLMQRYKPADLARLAPLLDHPEGDARIGAAWAILHVTTHARP